MMCGRVKHTDSFTQMCHICRYVLSVVGFYELKRECSHGRRTRRSGTTKNVVVCIGNRFVWDGWCVGAKSSWAKDLFTIT